MLALNPVLVFVVQECVSEHHHVEDEDRDDEAEVDEGIAFVRKSALYSLDGPLDSQEGHGEDNECQDDRDALEKAHFIKVLVVVVAKVNS